MMKETIDHKRRFNAYHTLKPGDQVVVSFGRFGSQKAKVVGRTASGLVKVRKYRANSRSWTKPVTIRVVELVGW
jgi:hypothetical protein